MVFRNIYCTFAENNMEKQEEWRPVVGYEDFYEVSDWGRVKSLHRGKERILKPAPDKWGYMQVVLCRDGERETCQVHILVMQAFVGRCPAGYEIDHYDWNPSNNKLENLSYQPRGVNRARKSPEWYKKNAKQREKMYQDPEWRKNHAEATKKRSQDQEWQKNVREGAKKRAADPEWRRKNAEAMKIVHQDQEYKKKHSEAMQKLAQDPEWLQNVAEANRRKAQDPEWQRKTAEANRKKVQDPEWQRKNAEVARKKCKPVDQFMLDGQFVKRWSSATEAARELGVNNRTISACCKGKRKSTGGYVWKYA